MPFGILPVLGSILGGGAAIASGVYSARKAASGQREANQSNERIARENREFQERMSSTAYQRAAGDLEAAGLNRILALGSPASTPGGATATMGNVGAAEVEGFAKGSASATALRIAKQDLKNLREQEKKIRAEEGLTKQTHDESETRELGQAINNRLNNLRLKFYTDHPAFFNWKMMQESVGATAGGIAGTALGIGRLMKGAKGLRKLR